MSEVNEYSGMGDELEQITGLWTYYDALLPLPDSGPISYKWMQWTIDSKYELVVQSVPIIEALDFTPEKDVITSLRRCIISTNACINRLEAPDDPRKDELQDLSVRAQIIESNSSKLND